MKTLGIANDAGGIRAGQQGKWRQINKFVEILDGLIEKSSLDAKAEIRFVDLGSGKGYLTFAAYDYFTNVRGLSVRMTGVDTKAEIVGLCSDLARACGFDGLSFVNGTISQFAPDQIDVMVALHACDTATDEALFKGIRSRAAIIVAAPCCHKEIRRQIVAPEQVRDVLKHGTLLEQTAEAITDGLRALVLERSGYNTRVFEFISYEHTAKNNMIAAVKRHRHRGTEELSAQIDLLKSLFGLRHQRLETLLNEGDASVEARPVALDRRKMLTVL